MASTRKFDVDVELKSPADSVWSAVKDLNSLFPKLFPETYKSIEILEGDGKSAGSVRLVTFAEGSKMGANYKSKLESVDEEKKTVLYRVLEGCILMYYNFYDDTVAVRAEGEGSVVTWSCEYEKACEEAPDGEMTRDYMIGVFQKLDAYLLGDNRN